LSTALSWVLGLLVGLLFVALAHLFYYAAIIILGGMVGYQLGVGIMTWVGFQLGFITMLVALALAIIFAFGAWYLKVPKLMIIVLRPWQEPRAYWLASSWRLGRFRWLTCSGARSCVRRGAGRSCIWRCSLRLRSG